MVSAEFHHVIGELEMNKDIKKLGNYRQIHGTGLFTSLLSTLRSTLYVEKMISVQILNLYF